MDCGEYNRLLKEDEKHTEVTPDDEPPKFKYPHQIKQANESLQAIRDNYCGFHIVETIVTYEKTKKQPEAVKT